MSRFFILLSLCLLLAPLISFATDDPGIPRQALHHCFIAGEFVQAIAVLRDAGLPLGDALLRQWASNPPQSPAIESAEQRLAEMAYTFAKHTPEQLHDKVVTTCLRQELSRSPDQKL